MGKTDPQGSGWGVHTSRSGFLLRGTGVPAADKEAVRFEGHTRANTRVSPDPGPSQQFCSPVLLLPFGRQSLSSVLALNKYLSDERASSAGFKVPAPSPPEHVVQSLWVRAGRWRKLTMAGVATACHPPPWEHPCLPGGMAIVPQPPPASLP